MWKFSKWARNRTSSHQAAMPEIKGETVPSQKALRFQQAFFPDAPITANDDFQSYTYKDVYKTPKLIDVNEIYSAMNQLSSRRVPGKDNIPSKILKATLEIIIPHIYCLFNLCYENSYCPSHFKKLITVVLQKPQKKDYTKAKAYRPVALLNTLGKALEAIVAKKLNFLATMHTLLLKSHMGGHKGTSTDHACHHLIEAVYAVWNSKKVASLLLLNVSGAFDNLDQARLIHNLRKRQVDTKIVQWIQSFLHKHSTIIKTKEHSTAPISTPNGISQGSSLSQVLYLFYNADLLEDLTFEESGIAMGYIDNIGILAVGKDTEKTSELLAKAHTNICEPWSRSHGSNFSLDKYQLVHLKRQISINITQPVCLSSGHTINAEKHVKYLGL